MGVDFTLSVYSKQGNHPTLKDGPYADCRLHHITSVFSQEDRLDILKFVDHPIDFSFYDKIDNLSYGDNTNCNTFHDPEIVLNTLMTIRNVLIEHKEEFSIEYRFREKGKDELFRSKRVYYKNILGDLSSAVDNCVFHEPCSPEVFDLRDKKVVKCRIVIIDKSSTIPGEEVVYEIIRKYFCERYWILNDMIEVCKYAIKHDGLVKAFTW